MVWRRDSENALCSNLPIECHQKVNYASVHQYPYSSDASTTERDIIESYGGYDIFCASYGVKPWEFDVAYSLADQLDGREDGNEGEEEEEDEDEDEGNDDDEDAYNQSIEPNPLITEVSVADIKPVVLLLSLNMESFWNDHHI
jgi:hypothetical protein